MPELPDLIYIREKLSSVLPNRMISEVRIKEPVVIRTLVSGSFQDALKGETFTFVSYHGPFLRVGMASKELIVHFLEGPDVTAAHDAFGAASDGAAETAGGDAAFDTHHIAKTLAGQQARCERQQLGAQSERQDARRHAAKIVLAPCGVRGVVRGADANAVLACRRAATRHDDDRVTAVSGERASLRQIPDRLDRSFCE